MIEYLLLVAVQATSAPPAGQQQDILVTARRLKEWRGKVSGQANGSRCRTTRSTGDRDLDRAACDSLRYCLAGVQPSFQAIGRAAAAERSRLLEEVSRKLEACGEQQHQLRVAALVEQRWKKSSAADDDR